MLDHALEDETVAPAQIVSMPLLLSMTYQLFSFGPESVPASALLV